MNLDNGGLLQIREHLYGTGAAPGLYLHFHWTIKGKVFESSDSAVPQIGNILVAVFFSVCSALGKVRMNPFLILLKGVQVGESALLSVEVAGNASFISANTGQWAIIQTAAGYFHLVNCAIRRNGNFFGTALPGALLLVGLPMIEDVPLVIDLHHAAVGVAGVVQRLFSALIAHIAVADNRSTIGEGAKGLIRRSIAKLMA